MVQRRKKEGGGGTRTWQLAKVELLQRLGRNWPVGAWLPHLRDLARILGSGQVNTQRAVAALAEEGYLLSLRGKGTLVRRVPTAASRAEMDDASTAAGGGRDFALVYAQETDPLIMRMVHACQQMLRPVARRLEMVAVAGQTNPVTLGRRFDGMVIFSPGPWMEYLGDSAKHAVVVASWLADRPDAWGEMDRVTVNQEHGGFLAGQYLRQMGCELGCFIGRAEAETNYDATSSARLRGFELGLGQKVDADRQMYGKFYGPLTGSHAFRRWQTLEPRPTGIFAGSDEIAVGFLMAALAQGLEPGKDFQLIGFDGQDRGKIPEAMLSTVEVPAATMGAMAARLLLQRLDDPTPPPLQLSLRSQLFLGQTTTHPAPAISERTQGQSQSHSLDR